MAIQPGVSHEETLAAREHNISSPQNWRNKHVLSNCESQCCSHESCFRCSYSFGSVAIVGMSWGLYGYDNSFVSPLLSLPHFVAKYQGSDSAFTALNLNLLVSVPLIGAALGSYLSVPIQQKIGRKWALIVAYSLFSIPGSILQLFAPNMAAFVIGRSWNSTCFL